MISVAPWSQGDKIKQLILLYRCLNFLWRLFHSDKTCWAHLNDNCWTWSTFLYCKISRAPCSDSDEVNISFLVLLSKRPWEISTHPPLLPRSPAVFLFFSSALMSLSVVSCARPLCPNTMHATCFHHSAEKNVWIRQPAELTATLVCQASYKLVERPVKSTGSAGSFAAVVQLLTAEPAAGRGEASAAQRPSSFRLSRVCLGQRFGSDQLLRPHPTPADNCMTSFK